MASGRRVAGAIRSLANARGLQLECARVLHESLLMHVFMYGSEIMIWAVQMNNPQICQVSGEWIKSKMYG